MRAAASGWAAEKAAMPVLADAGSAGARAGDDPIWSPMSSTLIHGEHDAVLVDTLVTFDQVDALTD
jgi:hypothetical protein